MTLKEETTKASKIIDKIHDKYMTGINARVVNGDLIEATTWIKEMCAGEGISHGYILKVLKRH